MTLRHDSPLVICYLLTFQFQILLKDETKQYLIRQKREILFKARNTTIGT